VRGALDPVEGAGNRIRERLGGRRLREPGHRLQQHVPIRKQRGGERGAQRLLTHDALVEDPRDLREERSYLFSLVVGDRRGRWCQAGGGSRHGSRLVTVGGQTPAIMPYPQRWCTPGV